MSYEFPTGATLGRIAAALERIARALENQAPKAPYPIEYIPDPLPYRHEEVWPGHPGYTGPMDPVPGYSSPQACLYCGCVGYHALGCLLLQSPRTETGNSSNPRPIKDSPQA